MTSRGDELEKTKALGCTRAYEAKAARGNEGWRSSLASRRKPVKLHPEGVAYAVSNNRIVLRNSGERRHRRLKPWKDPRRPPFPLACPVAPGVPAGLGHRPTAFP